MPRLLLCGLVCGELVREGGAPYSAPIYKLTLRVWTVEACTDLVVS
jgi:hypothetical protein